ncbi:hypothetical protein Aperf_G00000043550 [Anoplocephala perfoliata]
MPASPNEMLELKRASPKCIYTALSLALAGSESDSKIELISVLRARKTAGHIALCKSIGRDLKSVTESDEKKVLVQANGVFMQSGKHALDSYLEIVRKDFDALLEELDFEKDPEGARRFINKWVSMKTKSKIGDLLPEGSLIPDTRFVLVNALYFKGRWNAKFDKNLTEESNFSTLQKKIVKVQMMQRKGRYKIADFNDIDVRAVKIPFECHEMLILLPDQVDGFLSLLKKINENPAHLLEVLTSDQYFEEEVILKMPKFSFGGDSIQINRELANMGLKSIFSEKADFSGITGDKSLILSDVYHQAMIDVDEEGAEAAAATGISLNTRCAPRPPQEFFIDHPFLFFINTTSGIPVFIGQFLEPKPK